MPLGTEGSSGWSPPSPGWRELCFLGSSFILLVAQYPHGDTRTPERYLEFFSILSQQPELPCPHGGEGWVLFCVCPVLLVVLSQRQYGPAKGAADVLL